MEADAELTLRIVLDRAVEAQHGERRLVPELGQHPGGGHGQRAAGGPADDDEAGRVERQAQAGGALDQPRARPHAGVAHVAGGAVEHVDVRREAVVDADGEDAVLEQEARLGRAHGAARQR